MVLAILIICAVISIGCALFAIGCVIAMIVEVIGCSKSESPNYIITIEDESGRIWTNVKRR